MCDMNICLVTLLHKNACNVIAMSLANMGRSKGGQGSRPPFAEKSQ